RRLGAWLRNPARLMRTPALLWPLAKRTLIRSLPQRLYARSLIIVIAPMIILQSVIAFVFMERHWQTVTMRLSAAVTRDIAAVIDLVGSNPPERHAEILGIAQDRL